MATIQSEAEVIDLTGLTDSSDSSSENGKEVGFDREGGSEDDSDASEIEITLNEETRSQLQNAISTVSEKRLRQLLKVLIETDMAVEAALTRELVTLKRGSQKIVPRWETCGKCDEEFDTNTIREGTECEFHPGKYVCVSKRDSRFIKISGELEVLEENFADWDEACHGPMDTPANRRSYPENFQWTCCDNVGLSSGCVQGEHQPVVARKRKRLEE